MPSYVERHLSFGVDEFEGLWKVQFLHPFFFGNEKQYVSVYVIPPNSDFKGDTYNGLEVVEAGKNIINVMKQLLPRIEKYPYRWELEGRKLDQFGYDLVSGMSKGSDKVNSIDFTDIAFQEISRFYAFEQPRPRPDLVTEDEEVQGNGAMAKIQLTLEKSQWVNKVSFDFFSEYPVEVLALMYQEDTSKFSPVYEIPLEKTAISNSSLSFHFASVFAKRFTVIIQQPTYVLGKGVVLPEQKAKEDMWNTILAKNISGYLAGLDSWVEQTRDWQESVASYTAQQIETKGLKEPLKNVTPEEWRPEYQQKKLEYEQKQNNTVPSTEQASATKSEVRDYIKYKKEGN